MIKLIKDGMVMEVRNEQSAFPFLRSGYEIVNENPDSAPAVETEIPDTKGKKYTKSEIVHMSAADLKALAPTIGIEVTAETTGVQLKEQIIAILEL